MGVCFNVNRAAKDTSWLTKISPYVKITSKKQKVLKCVASLTGDEGRFDVNRNAKNTLVLINVEYNPIP